MVAWDEKGDNLIYMLLLEKHASRSEISACCGIVSYSQVEVGEGYYGFHDRTTEESMNHNVIWVIKDGETKGAHFNPFRVEQSIEALAERYVQEAVRLHGLSISIMPGLGLDPVHRIGGTYKGVSEESFISTWHSFLRQMDGRRRPFQFWRIC